MQARKLPLPLFLVQAAALLASAAAGAAESTVPATEPAALALAIDSIGITVSDLDRAIAFYTRVLGFEVVGEREAGGPDEESLRGVFPVRARVARLRLGDEAIELTAYVTPRGRSIPEDTRSNDRSFQHLAIVVSDMDAAYVRLAGAAVEHVSPAPQRLPDWNPAAGGIRAFYFRDPDRHALEVIWYPPGKGDPRWQARDGRLFLGIDHTAIVVADTAASLRFYREALGLRVVGTSSNHGDEQERLNAVRGARLRITALRAPAGPGIEFLEYLAPADGRPAPADLRANDLTHWQVRLVVRPLEQAAQRAREAGGRQVSAAVAEIVERSGQPARRRALLRDGDGHGIELESAAR